MNKRDVNYHTLNLSTKSRQQKETSKAPFMFELNGAFVL